MQGTDGAVSAQKEPFLAFLKTVKIKPGTAEHATAAAAAEAGSRSPSPPMHMMAPEGWESQPPGQMQVAKFTVSKDGGKADISVSVFPSDTGGTLANINRWRRQIGPRPTWTKPACRNA